MTSGNVVPRTGVVSAVEQLNQKSHPQLLSAWLPAVTPALKLICVLLVLL